MILSDNDILSNTWLRIITEVNAQRLVAQAHGHFRIVVTILAGFLQSHFGVFSLSLGHVACSHLLGLPLRKTLNAINGSLL
jgi:hypothetical protein